MGREIYPRNRSALVVLVVAATPVAGRGAPPGGAVEPRVRSPEGVQPARIGGITVVNDAVLEHERAQARPLARVGGHVGAGHGSALSGPVGCRPRGYLGALAAGFRLHVQRAAGLVVVFDGPLALLLLGD